MNTLNVVLGVTHITIPVAFILPNLLTHIVGRKCSSRRTATQKRSHVVTISIHIFTIPPCRAEPTFHHLVSTPLADIATAINLPIKLYIPNTFRITFDTVEVAFAEQIPPNITPGFFFTFIVISLELEIFQFTKTFGHQVHGLIIDYVGSSLDSTIVVFQTNQDFREQMRSCHF